MKGNETIYASLHKFRVDTLKTLQEAINKHFGDVYSNPDLGTKFTLFKKTVMKGLEKHYIEWEMLVRKEYKDYQPPKKVKHKKNLDGSNVTDMFGYFIYEDIEEEEE